MAPRTVKWFDPDKGFGFIAVDGSRGGDIFIHYKSIDTPSFKALNKNQRVEFEIIQGLEGTQADHIHPL